MRTLTAFLMNRLMRNGIGRWALTIMLLLIGAASFALYPTVSASGSNSDGLSVLLAGIFFTVLGLFTLVVTLRVGSMLRRANQTLEATTPRYGEDN
jgi:membrane associated rhomboid family serine protease